MGILKVSKTELTAAVTKTVNCSALQSHIEMFVDTAGGSVSVTANGTTFTQRYDDVPQRIGFIDGGFTSYVVTPSTGCTFRTRTYGMSGTAATLAFAS